MPLKQVQRDDKVVRLADTITEAYNLILEGEPLHKKPQYKEIYRALASQTIECGCFVRDYVNRSFGEFHVMQDFECLDLSS